MEFKKSGSVEENLLETSRKPAGNLSETSWKPAGNRREFKKSGSVEENLDSINSQTEMMRPKTAFEIMLKNSKVTAVGKFFIMSTVFDKKTFQIEAMIALITKMVLIFS